MNVRVSFIQESFPPFALGNLKAQGMRRITGLSGDKGLYGSPLFLVWNN